MKIKYYILSLTLLAFSLVSCQKDYLDLRSNNANVSIEKLYSTYTYVQGVLWNTYSYLPDGFATFGMEGATDNAEFTNESSGIQMFNNGTWNQFTNPDNVWSSNYAGIRQANLFLQNHSKIDIDYLKYGAVTDSTDYWNARDNVKFMKGEVLFLKAFFYFELVKRYGGVPIINKPMEYADANTWKNIPRNSVDECIKHITLLCDSAAKIIPVDVDTKYTWYDKGRVTYGAILALKSRALLYGASPLFKDQGSTVTWEDAAKAAYDVIALNKYSLVAGANYADLFGSNNTTQTEYIFMRNYGSTNSLEFANLPIVFDKSTGNSITPSQNLVDAFEVVNAGVSVPFDWNNPAHASAPYANRDVRFVNSILYNGVSFSGQTIQTYTGGNCGLPNTNATKTGYYLKKWQNPTIDLVNNTTAIHAWGYFRYAEILLNYAEAMYNAYGENADPKGSGMTALEAFNKVRARAGVSQLTAGMLTQAKIENERRVEFCFEDQRFWDLRRWKKAETYLAAPLKKIIITNTGTATAPVYTYEVKTLETRTFLPKMNWYPIPQSEISKTDWTQNTGW